MMNHVIDINQLPDDLAVLYVRYIILEVVNATNTEMNKIDIDSDLLDKFAKAILESKNIYIDLPVYLSLLTMILNQEYNIDSNIYDKLIGTISRVIGDK